MQLILLQAVLSQEQVAEVEHIHLVVVIQAHLLALDLVVQVAVVQVDLHQDQEVQQVLQAQPILAVVAVEVVFMVLLIQALLEVQVDLEL